MPVGWSCARYSRDAAVITSSPQTTHLPRVRHRPAGIRAYTVLTRKAASTVIGRDGMEKPDQSPMISTS